eukprot:5831042-Pyramimonas_sp.AAC.1
MHCASAQMELSEALTHAWSAAFTGISILICGKAVSPTEGKSTSTTTGGPSFWAFIACWGRRAGSARRSGLPR